MPPATPYTELSANKTFRANELNSKGSYYLNRSYCYFELGGLSQATGNAQMAEQKGAKVNSSYLNSLKFLNL